MLFQISNPDFPEGKKTHVGVMEFTATEGQCYVPYWVNNNNNIFAKKKT